MGDIPINKIKIRDSRFVLQDIRIKDIDDELIENSKNPVTSGAVEEAISDLQEIIEELIPEEVNIINEISANGTILPVIDRRVDIIIPTELSDLNEDTEHRTVSDAEKQSWNAKQDIISDLDEIRSGAALGATAIQEHQDISGKADKAELASVATSGDYDDLDNKPSIPQVSLEDDVLVINV